MPRHSCFAQKLCRTLKLDLKPIVRECGITKESFKNFLDMDWETWAEVRQRWPERFVLEVQHFVRKHSRALHRDYANFTRNLDDSSPTQFAIEGSYDTLPKCQFCGTWFFKAEKFGSLKCCHDGALATRVQPLQPLPPEYRAMLLYDIQFRQRLRALNSCLSFSSIGVKYGEFEQRPRPSSIRVSGKIYSRILHAQAEGPLRYYVHDPVFEGRSSVIEPSTLQTVQALVELHNPFATYLRQLGLDEHEHHVLELSWKPSDQQSSELASVVYKPDFTTPSERSLCVYRTSNQFHDALPDMQPLGHNGYSLGMHSPVADAMQYVLLFWGAHKDAGYCWQTEQNMADRAKREGHQNHHKISHLEHTRYRMLAPERTTDGLLDQAFMLSTQAGHVLPFNRFQVSDRLAGEWLINSFMKLEDERLMYQRKHSNVLMGRAPGVGDSHTAKHLHHSLHGSPAHMKLKVADGLHIVHKMGKPLFFITLTCNPKWPEITSALLPGQAAADHPSLTTRVFKLKKEALLDRLKAGLIFVAHRKDTRCNNVVHFELKNERNEGFIITVIEYQKRGLPHAHIAYRPACNEHDYYLSEEAPCGWVDRYVTGQIPDHADTPGGGNRQVFKDRFGLTDVELDRLRELVQKHMLHDKGKRHKDHLRRRGEASRGGCLDDNGNCTRYYPRPTSAAAYSTVDSRGYVVFERHTEDDRWVVPYNPHILLMFDSHCNVEIAGMVNIIFYLYKYLYKGNDKAQFFVRQYRQDHAEDDRDKMDEWLIGRYVSSMFAAWRIMDFNSYTNQPSVTSITLHLPNSGRDRKGTSDQDKYFFRPDELAEISIAGLANGADKAEQGLFEKYIVTRDRPALAKYVEGENLFRSNKVPNYHNATEATDSTWWYCERTRYAPTHYVRLANVMLTQGLHALSGLYVRVCDLYADESV